MTGRRTIVHFIMITIVSSGMIIMSGCGKKVTTTRMSETVKPAEVSQARGTETVAVPVPEPPVPKVEEPRELELKGEAAREKKTIKPVEIVKGINEIYKGINDIYFDFDRYLIRDDARKTLDDNAGILKGKPLRKVVIEGHCDERGTTDYNIALGERRAEAAKRYLTTLGIDSSKISIISFGKEKPFCKEHNEACWQNNRRGHFAVAE